MRALRASLSAVAAAIVAFGCAAQEQSSQQEALDRVAAEHAGDSPVPAAAADITIADPQAALTQTITYGRIDGTSLQAFVAWPEAAEAAPPGVIVVHEWWGLNDNVKEMTRKLAEAGYLAFAVDLFDGAVAKTPDEARALVEKTLANEGKIGDTLRQAYQFLSTNAQVPSVGMIGWCFGGGVALEGALMLPELDAVVMYYGRLVHDRERLAGLQAPLLGIFGQLDDSIPPTDVEKFEQLLRALEKPAQFRIYPGAGHAFANPSGTSYEPEAAADAWRRTLAFFDEHLKG
jgi:carboxymethylenebutenolidase